MSFLTWANKVFSEADGTPSSRRILFAIAVVFALGIATGALYAQRVLTTDIRGLVETVIWATAACLGVGKFAEGKAQ